MQKKTIKTTITTVLLAMLLLAMVPAAYSMDMHRDAGPGAKCDGHMMHHKMIERIDIPVTVTGASNDSSTYTINAMAIKGMKDKVMVVTLDKPLAGAYNATSDMGYMYTGDRAGMNIRVDTIANSTIPVAGTSGIMSIVDPQIEYKGKDYTIVEFRKLAIYLPDGTAKTYIFEKPIKMLKSKDRKMAITDAYPAYTKEMTKAFQGGATFPAEAAPVALKDIITAERSANPELVRDTRPQAAAPPQPTATAQPAPTTGT